MAFTRIGPLASVLHNIGLKYILQDTEVDARYSLCKTTASASPQPLRKIADVSPAPALQQHTRAWQPKQPPSYGQRYQRPAAPAKPAVAADVAVRPQRSTVIPGPHPDAAAWPQEWQTLLAKTRPGWLAWTYWDLGWDLCGKSDPARKQYLTALITELKRPAGTHTFWPPALPPEGKSDGDRLIANKEAFWGGLRLLGARFVVVLGSRTGTAIGLAPSDIRLFKLSRYHGTGVIEAWDLSGIAGHEERLHDIVTYLNCTFQKLGL